MDKIDFTSSVNSMYSPLEKDTGVLEAFRLELLQALAESEEVRRSHGLTRLPDGQIQILDLPLIQSLGEETKEILRTFIKSSRKPLKLVSQEVVGGSMSPEVRRSLQELYEKIDDLKRKAKPRRVDF